MVFPYSSALMWLLLTTPLHTPREVGEWVQNLHTFVGPARWPCQMLCGKLYDFARYGCRREESVGRLLETFAELHLPLGFLSQTENQ